MNNFFGTQSITINGVELGSVVQCLECRSPEHLTPSPAPLTSIFFIVLSLIYSTISHFTWACVCLWVRILFVLCVHILCVLPSIRVSVSVPISQPVALAVYLCICLSGRLSIVMGVCLRALSRFIPVFSPSRMYFFRLYSSSLFAAGVKWLAQLYFPIRSHPCNVIALGENKWHKYYHRIDKKTKKYLIHLYKYTYIFSKF